MNDLDTQNKEDLDIYTINYNFLHALSALTYGTEEDFINDNLKKCLSQDIISAYSAFDPIWLEYGIIVEDCTKQEPCMIYENPYLGLKYSLGSDEVQNNYWPYAVKKVNLPIGWKLEKGCDNMVPSAFRLINDNGKTIKTLSFFDDHQLSKPKTQNVLDMIDSVFDEMDVKSSDNKFTLT